MHFLKLIIFLILFYATCFIFVNCSSSEVKPQVTTTTTTAPTTTTTTTTQAKQPIECASLSWEKNHPERAEWSKYLCGQIGENLTTLDMAKDISKFCPKYETLKESQRVNVWGELFAWLSYYESGWDIKSASQDVGDEDPDTWSIGLFSVSVVDQKNYSFKSINYTYNDLLTAKPNIDLTMKLIVFQINKVGKIIIGPDRKWLYFATLHTGGIYDQSDNIILKVKKLEFCK